MANGDSTLRNELAIIPRAFVALSPIVVAVTVALALAAFRQFEPNPPRTLLQVLFGAFFGIPLAALVLAAGYVNGDAKRRGMNATVWTLLVALVPWAIGFILYLGVRRPIQRPCPRCGALVDPSFSFCPACRDRVNLTCARCARPVETSHAFCPYCGEELRPGAR